MLFRLSEQRGDSETAVGAGGDEELRWRQMVSAEREACAASNSARFEASWMNFSSSSSGGLCELLQRCRVRATNKLCGDRTASSPPLESNATTASSSDVSDDFSNGAASMHGTITRDPRVSVETIRATRRELEYSQWQADVSPDGSKVACCSPFEPGWWILTISSITTSREGANAIDRDSTSSKLLGCTRIARPDAFVGDGSAKSLESLSSFVSRVAWTSDSSIVAVLLDSGGLRFFGGTDCRPMFSRRPWYPPPTTHQDSTSASTLIFGSEHVSQGKGAGSVISSGRYPRDDFRAIDIYFQSPSKKETHILHVLCEDRRIRRFRCVVEGEQGTRHQAENSKIACTQGDILSDPVDLPDADLRGMFSSVSRIVSVPGSGGGLAWVFGLRSGANNNDDGHEGFGEEFDVRGNTSPSWVCCWDLATRSESIVPSPCWRAPIMVPNRGAHERYNFDESELTANSFTKGIRDTNDNTVVVHQQSGPISICRCYCCREDPPVQVPLHSIRSVAVLAGEVPFESEVERRSIGDGERDNAQTLATVDLSGVVSVWSFRSSDGELTLISSTRHVRLTEANGDSVSRENQSTSETLRSTGPLRRLNRLASFMDEEDEDEDEFQRNSFSQNSVDNPAGGPSSNSNSSISSSSSSSSSRKVSGSVCEVLSLVVGASWLRSDDGSPALFLLHENGRTTLFPNILSESSLEGTRSIWRNPEFGRFSIICETSICIEGDTSNLGDSSLVEAGSENYLHENSRPNIGFVVLHPGSLLNRSLSGEGSNTLPLLSEIPCTSLVQVVTPTEELKKCLVSKMRSLLLPEWPHEMNKKYVKPFVTRILDEYAEALTLCDRFESLDRDLVYKHAWEKGMRTLTASASSSMKKMKEMDGNSRDEYLELMQKQLCVEVLSKVKDHKWVSAQCASCVAHSYSQAKALLEYGHENSLKYDSNISAAKKLSEEDLVGVAAFEMQLSLLETYKAILDDTGRPEILPGGQLGNLVLSQLQHAASGTKHQKQTKRINEIRDYDSKTWQILRFMPDEKRAALYFLQNGQFRACAVVMGRYWSVLERTEEDSLRVFLETIFHQMPDTIPPYRYEILCPKSLFNGTSVGEMDRTLFPWETIPKSETKKVVDWYCKRARSMDSRSGQLLNALSLCDIGISSLDDSDGEVEIAGHDAHFSDMLSCDLAACSDISAKSSEDDDKTLDSNLLSLRILRNRIFFLYKLVYAAPNQLEFGLSALSLHAFESMSGRERLDLVLRGCSPETVVSTLRQHIRPLMGKDTKSRSSRTWINILSEYMVSITARDSNSKVNKSAINIGLRKSQAIICASAQSLPKSQRIIPHTARQVRVALDVVHACPSSHDVDVMYAILDSMPDLSEHAKKSAAVRTLMDEIDKMEMHIDAAEVLRGSSDNSDASSPFLVVPMDTFLPPDKVSVSDNFGEEDEADLARVSQSRLSRVNDVLQALCYAAREAPSARFDLDRVWRPLFAKLVFLRRAFNDAISLAISIRQSLILSKIRANASATKRDLEKHTEKHDSITVTSLPWSIEDECRILCVSHMLQIGAWDALKGSLIQQGDNDQKNSDIADLCPVSQAVLESAVLVAARESFNGAKSLWDGDALSATRMMLDLVICGDSDTQDCGEDEDSKRISRKSRALWARMEHKAPTTQFADQASESRIWVRNELIKEMDLLEVAEIARDLGWEGLVPLQLRLTTPKTQLLRMLVQKSSKLAGDNKPSMLRFAECLGIDAAATRSIIYSSEIRSAAKRGDLQYALKSCVDLLNQEVGTMKKISGSEMDLEARNGNSHIFLLCADIVNKVLISRNESCERNSYFSTSGNSFKALTSELYRDLTVFKSVLFNLEEVKSDSSDDALNIERNTFDAMIDEIIRLGIMFGPIETLEEFMHARSVQLNGVDYQSQMSSILNKQDLKASNENLLRNMSDMLDLEKAKRAPSSLAFHWKRQLNDLNFQSTEDNDAGLLFEDLAEAVKTQVSTPDVFEVMKVLEEIDESTNVVPDFALAVSLAVDLTNGKFGGYDGDANLKKCLEMLISQAEKEDESGRKSSKDVVENQKTGNFHYDSRCNEANDENWEWSESESVDENEVNVANHTRKIQKSGKLTKQAQMLEVAGYMYAARALAILAPTKIVSLPYKQHEHFRKNGLSAFIHSSFYLLSLKGLTAALQKCIQSLEAQNANGGDEEQSAATQSAHRLLSWSQDCMSRMEGSILLKTLNAVYEFAVCGTENAPDFSARKFSEESEYRNFVLHTIASITCPLPRRVQRHGKTSLMNSSKYGLQLAIALKRGINQVDEVDVRDVEVVASSWDLCATHVRCILQQNNYGSSETFDDNLWFIACVMDTDSSNGDLFMRNIIVPVLDSIVAGNYQENLEIKAEKNDSFFLILSKLKNYYHQIVTLVDKKLGPIDAPSSSTQQEEQIHRVYSQLRIAAAGNHRILADILSPEYYGEREGECISNSDKLPRAGDLARLILKDLAAIGDASPPVCDVDSILSLIHQPVGIVFIGKLIEKHRDFLFSNTKTEVGSNSVGFSATGFVLRGVKQNFLGCQSSHSNPTVPISDIAESFVPIFDHLNLRDVMSVAKVFAYSDFSLVASNKHDSSANNKSNIISIYVRQRMVNAAKLSLDARQEKKSTKNQDTTSASIDKDLYSRGLKQLNSWLHFLRGVEELEGSITSGEYDSDIAYINDNEKGHRSKRRSLVDSMKECLEVYTVSPSNRNSKECFVMMAAAGFPCSLLARIILSHKGAQRISVDDKKATKLCFRVYEEAFTVILSGFLVPKVKADGEMPTVNHLPHSLTSWYPKTPLAARDLALRCIDGLRVEESIDARNKDLRKILMQRVRESIELKVGPECGMLADSNAKKCLLQILTSASVSAHANNNQRDSFSIGSRSEFSKVNHEIEDSEEASQTHLDAKNPKYHAATGGAQQPSQIKQQEAQEGEQTLHVKVKEREQQEEEQQEEVLSKNFELKNHTKNSPKRSLGVATEVEFGLGSDGMLQHVDLLLNDCESHADIAVLVSVLTGNSYISSPEDFIFEFGDWEEQDAKVAMTRLASLHKWRQKGAQTQELAKTIQVEEMISSYTYVSPFSSIELAEDTSTKAHGSREIAKRWARLVHMAFDLKVPDEAIVALLRGPAREILSIEQEMALLDHFESTLQMESANKTSPSSADQFDACEENQSQWLIVASGLVSRHLIVRRRALWYWAKECSEEDEGLEEGALQITSSLLCRIDLQYINSEKSCRELGLMHRLMARVLRAMEPPQEALQVHRETSDTLIGKSECNSAAAVTSAGALPSMNRVMTRSPLLSRAESPKTRTPKRLSMRRRSTITPASGFGGLLALFRFQQQLEGEEYVLKQTSKTPGSHLEPSSDFDTPSKDSNLTFLPSTVTLRFFVAMLSLQRCEVESGFLLMHFFDTCSGLRSAGAAWAVLEHFLRSRTAGLPAGNGDMYVRSRGKRLYERLVNARGRKDGSCMGGRNNKLPLFDIYEYSIVPLEAYAPYDGRHDGDCEDGAKQRQRMAGALLAFKIMDRAAFCLGVD